MLEPFKRERDVKVLFIKNSLNVKYYKIRHRECRQLNLEDRPVSSSSLKWEFREVTSSLYATERAWNIEGPGGKELSFKDEPDKRGSGEKVAPPTKQRSHGAL